MHGEVMDWFLVAVYPWSCERGRPHPFQEDWIHCYSFVCWVDQLMKILPFPFPRMEMIVRMVVAVVEAEMKLLVLLTCLGASWQQIMY